MPKLDLQNLPLPQYDIPRKLDENPVALLTPGGTHRPSASARDHIPGLLVSGHGEGQAAHAYLTPRDLDAFLTDKDAVAADIEELVRRRAGELGLEVVSVGIRDVILPGDMKDLMNRVTEAKKAAEANLIARREETAAMRSQANTAKLLESSPTLMRLRELEVLEKIATASDLKVVLGEKGLADRVVNLL